MYLLRFIGGRASICSFVNLTRFVGRHFSAILLFMMLIHTVICLTCHHSSCVLRQHLCDVNVCLYVSDDQIADDLHI